MKKSLVLITMALTALVWLAAPSHAQTKSLYAKRYDADIQVLSNGELRVTETLEIVFQGGPFHYGYRVIALKNLDQITDVEVWGDGVKYTRSPSGQANTFHVSRQPEGLKVQWFFHYTSDATRTFQIRYTVKGAVRRYPEGDEVWWMAIHDDHDYTIRNSTVTLQLPPGVTLNTREDGDGFMAETDGVSARLMVRSDRRSVAAVAEEPLEAGEYLAIGVKFTAGVIAGEKPSWQEAFDRKAEWDARWRPVLNLLLGLGGVLVLIGTSLAIYLLWYRRGRDPYVGPVADYLAAPPGDDPPGVVGTLVDERADLQDVVATLVDLARRGYLNIREEQERGFAGLITHRDFVFERTDKQWDGLRRYERRLLKKIFGHHRRRDLSDLKNKFYKDLPKIQEDLYDAVVEAGYFRSSPKQVRRRYALLGWGTLVLAIAGIVVPAALLSEWVDAAWCPGAGLLVGAVLLLIAGRVMPAKTRQGAEAKARWEAFRRYLKEIERYTDLEAAAALFERYLPYAIAFNLERRWVNKFARVETVPIPRWYYPYWVGSGGYAHPSGGGEGGGQPSVQSVSDSLAGGFQSISDSLVSMFNSVGKTFTSAPSSSGSGGFSGGGFSGGGSSGGGSSGFG